jgi:hypothetical protein
MVQRMREILSDPTMQEALMALHDSNLPSEPNDNEEAIASVRRHSRAAGFNNAIAALLTLGDLVPVPMPEEETDYTTR